MLINSNKSLLLGCFSALTNVGKGKPKLLIASAYQNNKDIQSHAFTYSGEAPSKVKEITY